MARARDVCLACPVQKRWQFPLECDDLGRILEICPPNAGFVEQSRPHALRSR